MAMDISGLNPTDKVGEYFRASIWTWYPLVEVMKVTCSDFMSDIFFDKISCNVGTSSTKKESLLIANRLIQYSEHNINGVTLHPNKVSPVATAIVGILDRYKPTSDISEFYVDDARLQDWITFLQSCGGFTVN